MPSKKPIDLDDDDSPAETRIWHMPAEETTHVLVLQKDVFFAGRVPLGEYSAFTKKMAINADPRAVLGEECSQVAIQDITRVIANNTGNLIVESEGETVVKLPLMNEGVNALEAIEELKGPGWIVDVLRKARIGSALLSLLLGLAMCGGLIWVYYEVITGKIDRMHWFGAMLVNTFGPVSLLVLGALFVLGGMAGFGYYLTHPAEVWTLEEE